MNNISLPSTMSDSSPKPPGRFDLVPKTLTYGARVEDVLREKEPDAVNDDDVLLLENETQEPESPNIVKINEPEASEDTLDITVEPVITQPESEEVDLEKLESELRREMADYAAIIPRNSRARPLIRNVLAKVVVSKELDAMAAAAVQYEDGEHRKPAKYAGKIRDGVYLVLKGEGKFPKFFGGRHYDKIGEPKMDAYLESLNDESEFDQFSLMEQRAVDKQMLQEWIDQENGALLEEPSEKDDCIIARVLLPHPDENIGDEVLTLVCKNGEPEPAKFGGKHSWKILPSTIEAYRHELINAENFEQVSNMVEGALEEIEQRKERLDKSKDDPVGKSSEGQ